MSCRVKTAAAFVAGLAIGSVATLAIFYPFPLMFFFELFG